MIKTPEGSLDENSIQVLTEMIYLKYGYDFSDYSKDSFERRLNNVMIRFNIPTLENLKIRILEDDLFFNTFLEEITVNVTEMFRDPDFFSVLRSEIIPALSKLPLIRIWHAGCSTGEEVYSVAILLHKAGLLEKSLLYATDINQHVLEKASSRKFPVRLMEQYEENYFNSGGKKKLSDYYVVESDMAVFHESLKNRMVFSPHNLVADQSFNEFNLILCRNVLIYFNHNLQNRVVGLFADSLAPSGFLALGSKEGIDYNFFSTSLEVVNRRKRIWQKK